MTGRDGNPPPDQSESDPTMVTVDAAYANLDAYMHLSHKWAAARAEWERTYYDLTAEVDRLRAALREIRDADPVDMALDPGWAARIARAAFDEQESRP